MAKNNYIVVFKNDADSLDDHLSSCLSKVESQGGKIKHKYDSRTMKGFAAELDDDLKTEFENHPAVKYVEPDGPVSTQ